MTYPAPNHPGFFWARCKCDPDDAWTVVAVSVALNVTEIGNEVSAEVLEFIWGPEVVKPKELEDTPKFCDDLLEDL